MNAMVKRLKALEAVGPQNLSPDIKVWLGYPLTPAEQAQIDAAAENDGSVDPDFDAIDTGGWSREAKAWLGVG